MASTKPEIKALVAELAQSAKEMGVYEDREALIAFCIGYQARRLETRTQGAAATKVGPGFELEGRPNLKTGTLTVEVKKSFKLSASCYASVKDLHASTIAKVAGNRKIGPFTATSGLTLAYYLNASTNCLDKGAAADINKLMFHTLGNIVIPRIKQSHGAVMDQPVIIVGPEMAGGVMVAQLCSDPQASSLGCDYVYMRKTRKTSGTMQQLEGPTHLTSRTPSSPPAVAVWIDDCMSSGSSSAVGARELKRDYNIDVVAMLFLIDRQHDRKNFTDEKSLKIFGDLRDVEIYAIYDLDDVSEAVKSASVSSTPP